MNPKQRAEALRLLNYWEEDNVCLNIKKIEQMAALLRELLAEPVQEPLAWIHEWAPNAPVIGKSLHWTPHTPHAEKQVVRTPLYTHPPQQRKPLTNEVLTALMARQVADITPDEALMCRGVARAVERAHDIKEAP